MMAIAGALWLVSLDASKPPPLPLCETQEEGPELTTFEQLRPGSAFHVEVKWEAKAGWIPMSTRKARPTKGRRDFLRRVRRVEVPLLSRS